MKTGKLSIYGLLAIISFVLATSSYGARIKDIASISGVRDNQLVGYGLVVGLAGTGDDVKNGFTDQSLSNVLSRQGLAMRDKTVKSNNIAAVMVTATLPPFAKQGIKLDVDVSSMGSSKSLLGGMLLMTPLRGADGEVYAVAQGALTLGGFTTGGTSGAVKNHPSAGRITNGALVEREIKYDFDKNRALTINLFRPDFTTSSRLAAAINSAGSQVWEAKPVDSSSVLITLPATAESNIFEVISLIENLDVQVDSQAVVVMNEKTGTVVMGENVRISTVAIAHGNLSIQIKEEINVSQPLPFAPAAKAGEVPIVAQEGNVIVAPGGQTAITTNRAATATEDKNQLILIPRGVTIQDVIKALNAVGVTPRDLITILQTIKAAGALQADLRII